MGQSYKNPAEPQTRELNKCLSFKAPKLSGGLVPSSSVLINHMPHVHGSFHTSVPLFGIHPGDTTPQAQNNTCTPLLIMALFVITKY